MNTLTMTHPKLNVPITLHHNQNATWSVTCTFPDGEYDQECDNLYDAYNAAMDVSLVSTNHEYNERYL